ncbi:hypothetical protein Mnod_6332 [Methylobacterium nodulans ORS 2060]|uniref:Uncharacterized protein n=1 Tax=Methylobacterium nodulans (strain LMG 21967 / CNCM I-2342 / ORS 2060) TaxID=460265 RepID=B8IAT2_METNO|nr:hypothetical protein Mnod_6332 [Methylobacterium nodulans ORS 2060]
MARRPFEWCAEPPRISPLTPTARARRCSTQSGIPVLAGAPRTILDQDYIVSGTDGYIGCHALTAARTVQLPLAALLPYE